MYRIRPRAANAAFVVATLVAMATGVFARNYHPRPQNGYPAGMIPDWPLGMEPQSNVKRPLRLPANDRTGGPGVTKNASISPGMLPLLQVTAHRVTEKGEVVRKSMPIMLAPNMVAKDKHYDFKNKKTVLYAVGFWDHSWFLHTQAVGTAYSKRGYNVFITQTFAFFTQVYPKSVRIAPYIAKLFGQFLVKLTEQGLTAENLELVGLSLGAHVVGMAAKYFYKATGKKPSRVTGLDPSGPCFRAIPKEFKLDPSDGDKVDVIHTNIDGFGIADRLGQVDFYANGGEFQPGDIVAIPCLIICSHLRSVLYWWQALEHPKKFIGMKCDSVQDARFAECYNNTETNYFGLKTDFSKPGIYYLPTHNEFPYGEGKEGLKEENEIYTSAAARVNSVDNLVV